MEFHGVTYTLNQCEGSIYNWYAKSKVGEYTAYFLGYVFHTANGFYAAYRNDLSNFWRV